LGKSLAVDFGRPLFQHRLHISFRLPQIRISANPLHPRHPKKKGRMGEGEKERWGERGREGERGRA